MCAFLLDNDLAILIIDRAIGNEVGCNILEILIMENLMDICSETRMERLLNPQMSDHFYTGFNGKYGYRFYEIKVGRKWVFMRSNAHKVRMPLHKFKLHAFLQWRKDAMTDASSKQYAITGKYSRPRAWWKDYGFTYNPKDFNYDRSRLAW